MAERILIVGHADGIGAAVTTALVDRTLKVWFS